MSMTFNEFITTKPKLKYFFFGGKGGVGKTVLAAGAAYYFAEILGRKTLISSTNPIHSLSSAFGQDFWGKGICKVENSKNLYAIETDTADILRKYKQKLRDKIITYIQSAHIPIYPELFTDVDRALDRFVKVAMTNPAFEEATMFDDVIDLIFQGEFDTYVFDTAPVALTYRLFKMSKAYEFWLRRLVESIKVEESWRSQILNRIKKDPLFMGLLATKQKTKEGRKLLSDKDKTAFFFVTLPLALPIAVTQRFIGWIQEFKIPIGGIIVNEVIPREQFDLTNASPYLVNRIREQEEYLKIIHDRFSGLIRSCIPLYDTEVCGINMIAKVAEALGSARE